MPTDEGRTLQLRLSLSSNTSFKRSFEELFGGAESDGENGGRGADRRGGGEGGTVMGVGRGLGATAGAGGGREGRNKRQRSESESDQLSAGSSSSSSSGSSSSSLAFSSASGSSSTVASPSSSRAATTTVTSSNHGYGYSGIVSNGTGSSTTNPAGSALSSGIETSLPPRLPTPRLDDVQMSDIPLLDDGAHTRIQNQNYSVSSTSIAEPRGETTATITSDSGSGLSSLSTTSHLNSHSQRSGEVQAAGLQHHSSAPLHPSPLSISTPSTAPTPSIQSTSTVANPIPNTLYHAGMRSGVGFGSPSSPPMLGPSLVPVSRNTSSETEERFRATMERYNAFESAMAALRESPPRNLGLGVGVGASGPRTSPPRLPPLELSSLGDEEEEGEGGEQRREGSSLSRANTTAAAATATSVDRNSRSPPVRTRMGSAARAARPQPSLSLSLIGGSRVGEDDHLPRGDVSGVHISSRDDGLDGGDEGGDEFDELGEDEDEDEDERRFLRDRDQHQHQHQRGGGLAQGAPRSHSHGAMVGDAPPRIELSNSLWSSLGIGSSSRNDSAGIGGRGVVVEQEENTNRGAEDREEGQEIETDLVYPDPPFRDRLDSALEALRSPSSPLVPGLVPGERDSNEVEAETEDQALGVSSRPGPSSATAQNNNATAQAPYNVNTSPSSNSASMSRAEAPPTLPPIMTDADDEMWRRDSQQERVPQSQAQAQARVQVDIRGAQERRATERLGEVQVPSPSLSGFYDWLEGAGTNVPVAGSTRERSGSGSAPGSGLDVAVESSSGAVNATAGQTHNGGPRNWEEDVLSGFMSTDLGLNLGLQRREREQHGHSIAAVAPLGPAPTPSAEESVVMDVDMESDTEREREVERLPWTLGSSITSPGQAAPRLSFNRDSLQPQRLMPDQYRGLNLLHDADDEWDPVHATVPWHAGAGPSASTSASASASASSSMAPLPSFASTLFSSPSPPPLPRINPPSSISPSRPSTTSWPSRIGLPRFILSPRRPSASAESGASPHHFVPNRPSWEHQGSRGRGGSVGSTVDASLPPSLSLDLGLNNSVFGASDTSGSDTNTSFDSSNNITNPLSGHPQQDPLTRLFEQSPSQTQSRLPTHSDHQQHLGRGAFDVESERLRYRAPTRVVGSSNSLVSENAAEMGRRFARAELVRRLSTSQRFSRTPGTGTSPSRGGNERASSTEESTRQSLSGPEVGVPRTDTNANAGASTSRGVGFAWDRVARLREEAERLRRNAAREEGRNVRGHVGGNLIGARPRTSSQSQTQTQSGIQTRIGHLLSRSPRHTQSHHGASGGSGGGSLTPFNGLALPPRNNGGSNTSLGESDESFGTFGELVPQPRNNSRLEESLGSGSESSSSSNTGLSMYPGVSPPPPRPRLHSTRHMPSSSAAESTGPSTVFSHGHRRSTSWSQGSSNTTNADNNTSSAASRPPMTTEEAWVTMLGLRLPPDHASNPRPTMRLYIDPESESGSGSMAGEQSQRDARTSFGSFSSLDSSLSADSFIGSGSGSGVSNVPVYGGGGVPIPAPGRAMFLDTELPSPGLGGLFDTLGPGATTGRDSLDIPPSTRPPSASASATTFNSSNSSASFSSAGRLTPSPVRTSDEDGEEGAANESERLQRLEMRLGNMRNEMVNEMHHWWDRDEPVHEGVMNNMDVDRDQRGSRQAATNQRPLIRGPRRPDHLPASPYQPAATSSDFNSSSASTSSSERRNIIDPNLFAPGPFRNTMETLAMRAREYAAQASSSTTPAIPGTTMSSPTMSFSSSPSSSLSPPATYTFAPRSSSHVSRQPTTTTIQGTTQLPPVIPPLSFENDAENSNSNSNGPGSGGRSEVQEPLDPFTGQWINETDQILARYGSLRDFMRRVRNQRRSVEGGDSGAELLSSEFMTSASSASSVSSEGRPLSWSQLERSPDISGTGRDPHTAPSSGPSGDRRRSGEIEGLQHAIGVLRGDGLSVGRSVQFLEMYGERLRREAAERERQREEGRSARQERRQFPRPLDQIREQEWFRPRTANAGANPNPTWNASASANRLRGRSVSTHWHDVVMNRPASMEDVWENVESDSDSDEDGVDVFFPISRSSRAGSGSVPAPGGPRGQGQSEGVRHQRFRMGNNTNSGLGSGLSVGTGSGARPGTGGSGGAGAGDFGHPPPVPRLRMLNRLRGNNMAGGGNLNSGPGARRFSMFARRIGDLGDYMNDDEFDPSYESLLTLQAALGEVKPRSTPEAVLKRLQSAKYKEWAGEGSDPRCPICLEDYEPDDLVMKSGNCIHWQHKACLEKWLENANTCPVCRTDVEPRQQRETRCPRHRMLSLRRGSGGSSSGSGGSNSGPNGSNSGSSGNGGGGGNGGPGHSPSSSRFGARFGGGGPWF